MNRIYEEIKLNDLSQNDRENIEYYLAETNKGAPVWINPNENEHRMISIAFGHIRMFNYDAVKAADFWNRAIKKSMDAYRNTFFKILNSYPKETRCEIYENRSAGLFKNIEDQANQASRRVFEKEFYDKVYDHIDKINGIE